ncbi:Zn-dependent exopeptidase [Pluteus cervinus]|uniref:Zn-dependent exopeptidase n=1 Tax=Pluteus cervinus TaxID=181527 RepID=A0ACD3AQX3_9AGAR|nr:Zn-dependent exopeptidase [Pluteus cervinus]
MKLGQRYPLLGLPFALMALVNGISTEELEENRGRGLRLLSISSGEEPTWKTNGEKWDMMKAHVHFFDITDSYDPENEDTHFYSGLIAPLSTVTYPSGPVHQRDVKAIIDSLSTNNLQNYLSELTSFNNRFFMSETGRQASQWIFDTISNIALLNPSANASVTLFEHNFTQPSVIATIPGRISSSPVVILGAHMDSINLQAIGQDGAPPATGPSSTESILTDGTIMASATVQARQIATPISAPPAEYGPTHQPTLEEALEILINAPAPGADDDGSGSVDLIETFRALVVAGFRPSTTVEFHWYAGEEGGLLGSQDIANNYRKDQRQVRAMMQLDMTAYVRPGTPPVVAFIPDFVELSLNTFLSTLVDEYLSIGWVTSSACGYACSDHASWTSLGYPSAFPFESPFNLSNRYLHTPNDTTELDGFSFEHMLEYAKLGVAYAIELAVDPSDTITGTQTSGNSASSKNFGLSISRLLGLGVVVWTMIL